MAPTVRVTRSQFSSRVTVYEASAPSSVPSTPPSAPRRTRSTPRSAASDVKYEEPDFIELDDVASKTSRKRKPTPSPRKPKPHIEKLDVPHPDPLKWREQYEMIQKMRENIVAPVDTMGCEQGGRERNETPPSDKDNRLSILVSLMLSSQTKDPVTHQAVQNLRNQLPGGLTLEALIDATPEEIDACICKVGFHNIKTMNLKKLAIRLRDEHGGDVPADLHSLLAINGVGPKMAYLYLQAIGINAGIGVDTHVHRITNRLGWHKPQTNTAEQTRLNLESWLPKALHPKINHMLVGFGQMICKPIGPRCDLCSLAQAPRLCPSASRSTKNMKKSSSVSPVKRDASPKVEIEIERTIVSVPDDANSLDIAKVESSAVIVEEVSIKSELASPSKDSISATMS
ncbi:alpha,alpha-trehalase nth1 [Microbotryomycetes sp. JL201]|nr:alpha,alpha-trehalase nth1 [Microbotryomycetes sp. JL201]